MSLGCPAGRSCETAEGNRPRHRRHLICVLCCSPYGPSRGRRTTRPEGWPTIVMPTLTRSLRQGSRPRWPGGVVGGHLRPPRSREFLCGRESDLTKESSASRAAYERHESSPPKVSRGSGGGPAPTVHHRPDAEGRDGTHTRNRAQPRSDWEPILTAMTDTSMNTNMHSAFQREILRLREGLRKADLSDAKATKGLARRYKFFSVTLHQHHQGEDTFQWPNIRPKANPQEIAVLDAMEAEHGALASVLGGGGAGVT